MAGRVVPSYVDVTSYWTPWEHRVCYPCYCYNPYAIWLVKVGCFQPHRHLQCEYIRVVIDSNDMVLEPIRPVPAKLAYQQGPFIMCFGTFCRNDACTYAHTTFEVDMWNIKKALARGKHCLLAIYCIQGVSSLRSLIPFTPRACLKHKLIHLTIVLSRFIYLRSIVVW